jgi:hypothetical protein
MPSDGGTLRKLICKELPPITPWKRKDGEGPKEPEKHSVFYPLLLVEKIEERWKELGLESCPNTSPA